MSIEELNRLDSIVDKMRAAIYSNNDAEAFQLSYKLATETNKLVSRNGKSILHK